MDKSIFDTPDSTPKERLVNLLIEKIEDDIRVGDYTVLDELLLMLPISAIKGALLIDE